MSLGHEGDKERTGGGGASPGMGDTDVTSSGQTEEGQGGLRARVRMDLVGVSDAFRMRRVGGS